MSAIVKSAQIEQIRTAICPDTTLERETATAGFRTPMGHFAFFLPVPVCCSTGVAFCLLDSPDQPMPT
jgi:hypothetical protein